MFRKLITLLLTLAATQAALAQQPQRVGVAAGKQTILTLRDAVTMALENNRDIEIERLNTQLNEFDLRAAKGVYDSSLSSQMFYQRQTLPVASILAGGENGSLQTSDFTGSAILSKRLPWQGGSVSVSFDQNRSTSQNLFNALNPQFTSQLAVEFTQPLFRNRKIDAERRQIRIASKRLDLSDSQFRQRAIEIIAAGASALTGIWYLPGATAEIKSESVDLARTQLDHNRAAGGRGKARWLRRTSSRRALNSNAATTKPRPLLDAIQRAENALKALILPTGVGTHSRNVGDRSSCQWNKPQIDSNEGPLPLEDAQPPGDATTARKWSSSASVAKGSKQN